MDLQREYLRKARRKAIARGALDDFDDGFDKDDSVVSQERDLLSDEDEGTTKQVDDDEIDPLDAFMADITTQVKHESRHDTPSSKPIRMDQENEEHDSYMEEMTRRIHSDSDEEVTKDDELEDKSMPLLAPIDHNSISYETFRRAFYTPHPTIHELDEDQVKQLEQELQVETQGIDVPRPIQSFTQVSSFDRKILTQLMKLQIEAPTPIQAQAFPIALSGRDLMGIAKTGSGKTLAFTLPMIVHVMDQRVLRKDEGPIAIIMSPTRELAHQIYTQVKMFITLYQGHCVPVYGGVNTWEQIQALKKGAEVVVATPGRLMDLVRKKHLSMIRVTYVVLDEADRMFDMGFEPQIRSILSVIRPDRQLLMFSATFPRRIAQLAHDVLMNPIKITIGKVGQSHQDIDQHVVVLKNDQAKWPWLLANIKRMMLDGKVLIFATSKIGCETLATNLKHSIGSEISVLHGDKGQYERSENLHQFRNGKVQIMVATDVAARGLDVKDIKYVVNYDVARTMDTHVHRIGRTGRMGVDGVEPGTAYTLLTTKETQFAAQLVPHLDVSGQVVSNDLLMIAKRDPRFRRGSRPTGDKGVEQTENYYAEESVMDAEDVEELERWSKPKSKSEQRKGLGFTASSSSSGLVGRGRGGKMKSFVRASSAVTQDSIRTAFVKPTSSVQETVPARGVTTTQPLSQPAPQLSESTVPNSTATELMMANAKIHIQSVVERLKASLPTTTVIQPPTLPSAASPIKSASSHTETLFEHEARASKRKRSHSKSPRNSRRGSSRSRSRSRRSRRNNRSSSSRSSSRDRHYHRHRDSQQCRRDTSRSRSRCRNHRR